jgi:hypothetical protein
MAAERLSAATRAHRGIGMSESWSRLIETIAPALPNAWQTLAIVAGAAVLIWLTLRLRAWFHEDTAGAGDTIELLTDIQEMHRQGGLTEEEFRFIKTRLAQAAAGEGASRTKLRSTTKPAAARTAEAATGAPPLESPQGRSQPPAAEARSDDAGTQAQDAPRVDTP